MKSLNPYLTFQGNTEEVFRFYKSVFGGDFSSLQRFKDMPSKDPRISEKELDKILHIALPIGKAGIIYGSDALESHKQNVKMGNNIYIMIEPESETEAEHLFKRLSEGGKVDMPLQKTFWGALYASFSDKFGVNWMLNLDLSKK
jgi:PhnB protein